MPRFDWADPDLGMAPQIGFVPSPTDSSRSGGAPVKASGVFLKLASFRNVSVALQDQQLTVSERKANTRRGMPQIFSFPGMNGHRSWPVSFRKIAAEQWGGRGAPFGPTRPPEAALLRRTQRGPRGRRAARGAQTAKNWLCSVIFIRVGDGLAVIQCFVLPSQISQFRALLQRRRIRKSPEIGSVPSGCAARRLQPQNGFVPSTEITEFRTFLRRRRVWASGASRMWRIGSHFFP
jgi:hypothetical protein